MENKNNLTDTTSDTIEWYKAYYSKNGSNRNDLENPEVHFQELATSLAFTKAFTGLAKNAKVLDVGGGSGSGLLRLIDRGFDPKGLTNLDIIPDRIAESKKRLPYQCTSILGDASNMEQFEDNSFDIVMSMTMFIQLTDRDISDKIASEMIRVCKGGGYIIIFDWRYDFWKKNYLAVDLKRIYRLFHIKDKTKYVKRLDGPLVPPVGRFLSRHMPSLYFLFQKIRPIVGLKVNILRKK